MTTEITASIMPRASPSSGPLNSTNTLPADMTSA
jgi:hypothetical protein